MGALCQLEPSYQLSEWPCGQPALEVASTQLAEVLRSSKPSTTQRGSESHTSPLPELSCQLSTAPVLEQAGRAIHVAALGALLPLWLQVL